MTVSGANFPILKPPKALVLRVMRMHRSTMFGKNWSRTFIGDVENNYILKNMFAPCQGRIQDFALGGVNVAKREPIQGGPNF